MTDSKRVNEVLSALSAHCEAAAKIAKPEPLPEINEDELVAEFPLWVRRSWEAAHSANLFADAKSKVLILARYLDDVLEVLEDTAQRLEKTPAYWGVKEQGALCRRQARFYREAVSQMFADPDARKPR